MNISMLAAEVRETRRRLEELATSVRAGGGGAMPRTLDAGGGPLVTLATELPITGGPIVGGGTIGHADSGVAAGAYLAPNLTLDATGHATAAAAGSIEASASLGFAQLVALAQEDLTITVTGAATGDCVALGIPPALAAHNASSHFFGWVSATNTVTVRRSVVAADGSAPAAATVKARVFK